MAPLNVLFLVKRYINYKSGGHPNLSMNIIESLSNEAQEHVFYSVATVEPYLQKNVTNNNEKVWRAFSLPVKANSLWEIKHINRIYDVIASIALIFEDLGDFSILHFLNVPAWIYLLNINLLGKKIPNVVVHLWYHNKELGSPYYKYENLILKKYSDMIIVTSRWLLNYYKTTIGKEKVTYIPPPIDTKRFAPRDPWKARKELGLPESDFLIGHIGYLLEERGSFELLKSMNIVIQAIPQAKLVLAPLPLSRNQLRKFIRYYTKLKNNIIILPTLQKSETFYNAMDVVVLPFTKPYAATDPPLTCLETMASGTPLITTPMGEMAYIGVHERNVFFVRPDHKNIAEAIIRLFRNPDLREEIAINARKTSTLFSYDQVKAKILRTYYNIVKTK